MAYISWTAAELEDLISTMRGCVSLHDAIVAHNAKWKNGRSADSARQALMRQGRVASSYLKPSRRLTDLSVPDRVKSLVEYLKRHKSATITEICNALDISPNRVEELVKSAQGMSYQVAMPTGDRIELTMHAQAVDRLAVHRIEMEPVAGHLTFGVASDLHFASKVHRGECLENFVDLLMQDFKASRIFVPGDIFAGINMYPGQLNELECWGHAQQLDMAEKRLPKRDDLRWDIIGGNHDESLLKAAGANILEALAIRRPDVTQHGFYQALIDLAVPGSARPLKIELFHPDKAGAYAITYHMQKAIEQIPPGMKPALLFVGHEHQASYMPDYRGVAGFLCGCFEDQTLYLKRKHASPAIGGWVVDVGVDKKGFPKTTTVTWVKYHHSRRGPIRDGDARFDRSVGPPLG